MSRLPSLDCLRGVAALAVALPHYLMLGSSGWPAAKTLSILAVELFFVLSGFVLAPQILHCLRAPSHKDAGIFLLRRWMRTVPPYLVALGLIAILTANLYAPALGKYAIYVQNLFVPLPDAADFFPVAWSLSVEEWFYVVFAILVLTGRTAGLGERGFIYLTIAFAAAVAIARLTLAPMENWDAGVRRVVAFRLDSIAYGFLLACSMQRLRGAAATANTWLLALVPASGVLAFYCGLEASSGGSAGWRHLYPFSAGLFSVLVIAALVRHDALFNKRAAVAQTCFFLGKISYTIYLFHLPVILTLRPSISAWPVALQLIVYSLALVVFCTAFYFSFEAPILGARPHYPQSRRSAAPSGMSSHSGALASLRATGWRRAALLAAAMAVWAGTLAAVERSQQANNAALFYASLAAAVLGFAAVLRFAGLWTHTGAKAFWSACAAFAVLLPVADYAVDNVRKSRPVASVAPAYSFRQAKAEPEAFTRWWAEYSDAWQKSAVPIQKPDPLGKLPFVMAPNSHSSFFGAPIRINNVGFRGPDIAKEKGDRYRIFVLGESPTFGTMISAQDTTWVQALGNLVGKRLSCARPIEIVNAGTVGYGLEQNIERFRRDILPLQPDMIVSYHGYNSFRLIDTDIDSLPTPPVRRRRASLLVSEARFYFRMMGYEHAVKAMSSKPPTPYSGAHARQYEELAELALRHGVTPVLATLSLAVNANSPREVVDFYGKVFHPIERILPAIAEHNRIVADMARKPGVYVVDSRPGLDGEWDSDYFLDIVHLTHKGAARLAENIFDGVEPLLLGAGCRRSPHT